jgi:hypothetical protein
MRMAIVAIVILTLVPYRAEAKTKKISLPPYRASGVIPGTDLTYEKLVINDKGEVKISIVNPGNYGVSFTSNFSFYSGKGEYLTGFIIKGFAAAKRKVAYSLELDDYKAYSKAVSMKVLGRSGRMGKDNDDGDDDGEEE